MQMRAFTLHQIQCLMEGSKETDKRQRWNAATPEVRQLMRNLEGMNY